MKKKPNTKFKIAFSIIELLIALLIISCITAAFAPVITKKITHKNISLNNTKFDCSKFDPSGRCLMCDKTKCTLCSTSLMVFGTDKYVDPALSCDAKPCTNLDANCLKCASGKCTTCASGYKVVDGKCAEVKCNSGQYKEGSSCISCPEGTFRKENNHTFTTCEKCDPSCKTCADEPTKCTSCSDDRYDIKDDKCVKHPCKGIGSEIMLGDKKYCFLDKNFYDEDAPDEIKEVYKVSQASNDAKCGPVKIIYADSAFSDSMIDYCKISFADVKNNRCSASANVCFCSILAKNSGNNWRIPTYDELEKLAELFNASSAMIKSLNIRIDSWQEDGYPKIYSLLGGAKPITSTTCLSYGPEKCCKNGFPYKDCIKEAPLYSYGYSRMLLETSYYSNVTWFDGLYNYNSIMDSSYEEAGKFSTRNHFTGKDHYTIPVYMHNEFKNALIANHYTCENSMTPSGKTCFYSILKSIYSSEFGVTAINLANVTDKTDCYDKNLSRCYVRVEHPNGSYDTYPRYDTYPFSVLEGVDWKSSSPSDFDNSNSTKANKKIIYYPRCILELNE